MAGLTGRKLIASRCAKFFKDGDFVNLGIGVPLMCVNYLPEGVDLWLEAEIGTVGSGPTPSWDKVDIDVIDAGGQPASVIKGGVYMIMRCLLRLYVADILMQQFLVHFR